MPVSFRHRAPRSVVNQVAVNKDQGPAMETLPVLPECLNATQSEAHRNTQLSTEATEPRSSQFYENEGWKSNPRQYAHSLQRPWIN